MQQFINNRKLVIKALTGSHNYNLNGPTSDKDYKFFVLPTFEDLFYGDRFSNSVNSPEQDYTVQDIRQLTNCLWKANINFLEVLCSTDYTGRGEISEFLQTNKKELCRMHLWYLYSACIGMSHERLKRVRALAGKPKTGKNFSHAVRVLDFLCRFEASGFEDFFGAIWYDEQKDRQLREYLMEVKLRDELTQTDWDLLKSYQQLAEDIRPQYLCKGNDKLKEEMDQVMLSAIRKHITDSQ